MKIFNQLKKITPRHIWSYLVRFENIESFSFNSSEKVSEHIQRNFDFDGDLLDIFANNSGSVIHKWHHYIPIYDELFYKFRNTQVRVLEIGVGKGGSLKMWREYFGHNAIIFGVDVDESCLEQDGRFGSVRIGNQCDKLFLNQIILEMGG